uniref:CRAL-TRIO domain-containing protein n=1 Tax=Macrostomum lignano TaxID=282301 RepID=A0A1I8J1H3_9PLAT
MSSIRGDAQLASFSSMSEIRSLIAANTARLSVHPYRRPLSLSQPVRLGMFYSAADASALSLIRQDSGECELKPVLGSEKFVDSGAATGPCVTVNVDSSDRAEIKSRSCSSQIPFLVKFPERGDAVIYNADSCSAKAVIWRVMEALQQKQTTKMHFIADTDATSVVARDSSDLITGIRISPTATTQSIRDWTSTEASPSKLAIIFGVSCPIL